VWYFRPRQHKGAWRGKERVVVIGPKAQEILRRFFVLDIQAYLFSPAREIEQLRKNRRAVRKTKVQPSQACRKKKAPKKQPLERYTQSSYAHAVAAACDKAFPPPEHLARRRDTVTETGVGGPRVTDTDYDGEGRVTRVANADGEIHYGH
jgi:hypothetical protein